MFRRRLTIALAVIAAAAVAEGLLAVWALSVAERQVQRGRVASDIQLGFVELSASKQRLRTWVSQHLMGASADVGQRKLLQQDMRTTLDDLATLAQRAESLDSSAVERPEQLQRREALRVLSLSLQELDRAVNSIQPLAPQTDARVAWGALSKVFDESQGHDLRSLLAQSIARESAAVSRERAAADSSLRWMRNLWLSAAGTLALAALLLALHFTRALRGPLDKLSAGTRALGSGDLGHRIALEGSNEFVELARQVNAMAAELSLHREREAQARHRLEELVQARTAELQGALEALQQMDAKRRQLFADISHELRTPTTAIRGEAEVTLRGRQSSVEDYRASLQRIVDASRQLGMVIEDLLTMTRSDTDSLMLKRELLELESPLTEALTQARAIANERGVELLAESVPANLPVMGDPLRLRQILMCLLDNAIRYSRPGGKVRVYTRTGGDGGDTAHCEVFVVDEGIGICAQDLPRVFERNFRGESARRHRADGSGLGLSISMALARVHGGEISLESEAGVGTTACLRLPLASMVGNEAGVS